MGDLLSFFNVHGMQIIAILWSIDQILKIIAPLTANKWDDNVADIFGKFLAKLFPKKP